MNLTSSELENGIVLVQLEGRLDLAGTLAIENPFTFQTASRDSHVLVDLSGVDFMASIGMRMLVKSAKAVGHRGFNMGLLNPQPPVREALETSAIDTIVPIYTDVADAASEWLTA